MSTLFVCKYFFQAVVLHSGLSGYAPLHDATSSLNRRVRLSGVDSGRVSCRFSRQPLVFNLSNHESWVQTCRPSVCRQHDQGSHACSSTFKNEEKWI